MARTQAEFWRQELEGKLIRASMWRVELYKVLLAISPDDQRNEIEIDVPITWNECMMLRFHIGKINKYGLVPGNRERQLRLDHVGADRDPNNGTARFTVLTRAQFNDLLPVYQEVDFATI